MIVACVDGEPQCVIVCACVRACIKALSCMKTVWIVFYDTDSLKNTASPNMGSNE